MQRKLFCKVLWWKKQLREEVQMNRKEKKTDSWNLYVPVITSPKGKKFAMKKEKERYLVK